MVTITPCGYNAAVNVYDELNEWLDCTVIVNASRAEEAAAVLEAARIAWHEDEDPQPFGDHFERALISAGIPFLWDGEEVNNV